MSNCLQNGDGRYSDDLIIMLRTFDDLDHTNHDNKHNDAMIHDTYLQYFHEDKQGLLQI